MAEELRKPIIVKKLKKGAVVIMEAHGKLHTLPSCRR
jgi:hypothetical protein